MQSCETSLLLAAEYARQLESQLQQALLADQFKDNPAMPIQLRQLVAQSESLNRQVRHMKDYYDRLGE